MATKLEYEAIVSIAKLYGKEDTKHLVKYFKDWREACAWVDKVLDQFHEKESTTVRIPCSITDVYVNY